MKSLFFICHLLAVYGKVMSQTRDYTYVTMGMTWTSAQSYCRQNYGDLATITTEEENQSIMKFIGVNSNSVWIGLKKNATDVNWQWSAGEKVNFTDWSPNYYNFPGETCAAMNSNGWYSDNCATGYYCICCTTFTLVKESKTWKEALQYCRSHYHDLAFVNSRTLLDPFKTETEQADTARVWTGLRFHDGTWFWVNGKPLGSLVSLPSCPEKPYRCGAYNFDTYAWENRDCNEELNFVCYY